MGGVDVERVEMNSEHLLGLRSSRTLISDIIRVINCSLLNCSGEIKKQKNVDELLIDC